MDDLEIVSNQNVANEMIGYDIKMIQKINEMYITKILEKKYNNKLYGNIYVTGIDNVSYSNKTYQNPNDNNFIIDVQYSLIGITYFKNMMLAFVVDNIVTNNNQIFFKKGNVLALINKIVIQDKIINDISDPIIVVKVTHTPSYINQDDIITVGLICEIEQLVPRTPDNEKNYNIKLS